jgi:metal-sulfur cluster biosynthetic enzyme
MMQHNVKSKLGQIDGIESVKIRVDWEKPWTRDDMSEAARSKAQSHGYVI